MHRAGSWARWRFVVLMWLALILVPSQAWAFCGFFASSAKTDVYNDVTQVALMRHGTTTVLSMRNTYEGPIKDFAMVVPVPQILKKEDVKTLNDDLFDRLDELTAPRLVDYYEQDPCAFRHGRVPVSTSGGDDDVFQPVTLVRLEASFKVGEYDVEILSAKDSTKLESWLKANGYNIPKGASKALAPYIAQGMYFFVAKVDAKKIKFDKSGKAMLSPLQFVYESKDFTLPVRLGLLNSKGKQELSIFTFSLDQHYEVSNYPNAFIPTNLVIKDEVRHHFSTFYDALLQHEFDKEPGVVVTEYIGNSLSNCDPCNPAVAFDVRGLDILGRDILMERYSQLRPLQWMVRGRSWKANQSAQIILKSLTPDLEDCYKKFDLRSDADPGSLEMTLEVGDGGVVKSQQIVLDGFDGTSMRSCVQRVLGGIRLDHGGATVVASTRFFKSHGGIENANRWVLARMRARYSPGTMKDDLRFSMVPVMVKGGVGTPVGKTSYFNRFEPRFYNHSTRSIFQARYMVLTHWGGESACAYLNSGVWGRKKKSGKYVEATSSGDKFDPENFSAYIIAGPKELMSRVE